MNTTIKQTSFVSAITVIRETTDSTVDYLKNLSIILSSNFSDFEIIIIDQCSTDDTEKKLDASLTSIPCIRYIRLTQEVAFDVAMAAGAENAIGDFLVFLTSESDPIDIIIPAINECKNGSDIVLGVDKDYHASFFYRLLRPISGFTLKKLLNYSTPIGTTNFYCISRRAANAIMNTERFHHQFTFRIVNTGYKTTKFEYNARKDGKKRRTLANSISKFFQILVFNSTKPLRLMSIIGFGGSMFTFVVSLYALLINVFKNDVAAGWTTLMLFLSLMFALIFIILALFGEYLSRILDDNLNDRHYDVLFEKTSSVMLDEERQNVLSDSVITETNNVQTGRDR